MPTHQSPIDQRQSKAERKAEAKATRRLARADRRAHLVQRAVRIVMGVGLLSLLTGALVLGVWSTGVLDPLIGQTDDIRSNLQAMADDPQRAWLAVAAVLIPNIGLYVLLFENR